MEDDVEGSGSRGSEDPPIVTEGDDIIAESAEEAPIKVARDPGEPSQEEFQNLCSHDSEVENIPVPHTWGRYGHILGGALARQTQQSTGWL